MSMPDAATKNAVTKPAKSIKSDFAIRSAPSGASGAQELRKTESSQSVTRTGGKTKPKKVQLAPPVKSKNKSKARLKGKKKKKKKKGQVKPTPAKSEDEPSESEQSPEGTRVSPEELESDRRFKSFSEIFPVAGVPTELHFKVNESPPLAVMCLCAFQNLFTEMGNARLVASQLAANLCIPSSHRLVAHFFSTLLFGCGVVTTLQCTVGARLPIIQVPEFSYIIAINSLLSQGERKCNVTVVGNLTSFQQGRLWLKRLQEIKGAVLVASGFQAFLGISGIIGLLQKYITPVLIVPTLLVLAVLLVDGASMSSSTNIGVSLGTVFLLLIFTQHLKFVHIGIPHRFGGKDEVDDGDDPVARKETKMPIFHVSALLTVLLGMWLLCYILTATEVFPAGNLARTDGNVGLLWAAPWFHVLYPFYWGWPKFSGDAIVELCAAVLVTVVGSVGDYFLCAKIAQLPPPPAHTLNRGTFIDGLGSAVTALFGVPVGLTSGSIAIGNMAITRVASRRVSLLTGAFSFVLSFFPKIGAWFCIVPVPIAGGFLMFFLAVFCSLAMNSLSPRRYRTPRNLYIVCFSTLFALFVVDHAKAHPEYVFIPWEGFNIAVHILLKSGVMVAAVCSFFLNNTIPGTEMERGMKAAPLPPENFYNDFPVRIMRYFQRHPWLQWIPIVPTFQMHLLEFCCGRCWKKSGKVGAEEVDENSGSETEKNPAEATDSLLSVESGQPLDKDA